MSHSIQKVGKSYIPVPIGSHCFTTMLRAIPYEYVDEP